MSLVRLIYYSENQIEPGRSSILETLSSILSASNRNNKPRGITGALVFDDNWFLQILEGERGPVIETFDRLGEDHRHDNLVMADCKEVGSRTFANWWMGMAIRTDHTEHIFARFSDRGRFNPSVLSPAEMLLMAVELAKLGLHRQLVEQV